MACVYVIPFHLPCSMSYHIPATPHQATKWSQFSALLFIHGYEIAETRSFHRRVKNTHTKFGQSAMPWPWRRFVDFQSSCDYSKRNKITCCASMHIRRESAVARHLNYIMPPSGLIAKQFLCLCSCLLASYM